MAVWSGAVHAHSLQARRSRDPAPFPASPHQTGHAVLPHPAFRGPSPHRCRRCLVPLHGSRELIHAKRPEERHRVALPAAPAPPRLLAQEQSQPLAHVVVHLLELAAGVADPEVGPPAAQQAVELVHQRLRRFEQPIPRRGDRLNAVPHPLHRSTARPALQVPPAAIPPGFHLTPVEPQKIEALPSIPDEHHLGLLRVEREAQPGEDFPHPPQRFPGCAFCPTQDDEVVSVPDQLPQRAAVVLPEPVQFVEHDIRQQGRAHAPYEVAKRPSPGSPEKGSAAPGR